MAFKINGVTVKNPDTFKVERYNVTTMERLSNADMVGDLVAKKRKFYFAYDALTAEELDTILKAIWESDSLFYDLQYTERGKSISATVYVGSIPTELHYMSKNNTIWKNVSFNLIER